MKKTVLYILRLSLTLLIITALAAAGLSYVNGITKDAIAENQLAKTRAALAEVLPGAENMAIIDNGSGIVKAVYAPSADSPVQGWAVEVVPTSGFGGEIRLMVGISSDGKVTGISVIKHAETPGLGAVAAAGTPAGEAFRESFLGDAGALTLEDIDAISGATITSKAVLEGVNAALAYVANLG
jgi:electron transport complex protein RnfG